MVKGKHFFGQPVYGQLIKCLNKDKIVEMSRNHGGERYIKSFDRRHQLLTAYPQPLFRIPLGRIKTGPQTVSPAPFRCPTTR